MRNPTQLLITSLFLAANLNAATYDPDTSTVEPQRAAAPTVEEAVLAAKIIKNAAANKEAEQYIDLVYSVRNQQLINQLSRLKAEHANNITQIVKNEKETDAITETINPRTMREKSSNKEKSAYLSSLKLLSIMEDKSGRKKIIISDRANTFSAFQSQQFSHGITVELITDSMAILKYDNIQKELHIN